MRVANGGFPCNRRKRTRSNKAATPSLKQWGGGEVTGVPQVQRIKQGATESVAPCSRSRFIYDPYFETVSLVSSTHDATAIEGALARTAGGVRIAPVFSIPYVEVIFLPRLEDALVGHVGIQVPIQACSFIIILDT